MSVNAAPGASDESHTITLQLGGATPLKITLPVGDIPAEGIMPALRVVIDAVVSRAVEVSESKGSPISCQVGCAMCCRHVVLLSDIEARVLARLVEHLPEPRRNIVRTRFAAVRQRMAENDLAAPVHNAAALPVEQLQALAVDYFGLGIACPFLDDDRQVCSIYDDRPLACRKTAVTSPAELCAQPHDERVAFLRVPELGAAILRITSDAEPPQSTAVLLPFLLEWAEAHASAGPHRGADQWMQRFVQRLASS